MADHVINGLMGTTLEKIKDIVDASTVIGDPIITGETTIIPVSKISYGFASGGSDFPSKSDKELFGGGSGAGVTASPIAFLVINGTDVKLLHVENNPTSVDKVVGLVPDLVDKVSELVKNNKKDKNVKEDKAAE